MSTYWLSFSNEDGPLGVAIVDGKNFTDAIVNSHALNLNPGGEVLGSKMETEEELNEVKQLGGTNRFLSIDEMKMRGYEPTRDKPSRSIKICIRDKTCEVMDGACHWCLLQNTTNALAAAVFDQKDLNLVKRGIEPLGGLYNYCLNEKDELKTASRDDVMITAQTILKAATVLVETAEIVTKEVCDCPKCTARREEAH